MYRVLGSTTEKKIIQGAWLHETSVGGCGCRVGVGWETGNHLRLASISSVSDIFPRVIFSLFER